MKKYKTLLFLSILLSSPLFGGNNFTNAYIFDVSYDDVNNYLQQKHYHALSIYDPADPTKVLVTEQKSDTQEESAVKAFLKDLTTQFNTYCLSCTVYDSDILILKLYDKGKEVFNYNSDPGYFQNLEKMPLITGLPYFEQFFSITDAQFEDFKKRETVKSYTFCEELLESMLKRFHLPLWIMGMGYNEILTDEIFYNNIKSNGLIMTQF